MAAKYIVTEEDKAQITLIAQSMPAEFGTLKERKMLAIMSLPQYRDYQVKTKCEIIGITRRMWYHNLLRPKFKEKCVKYARMLFGQKGFEVLNAYVQKAIEGDVSVMERILETLSILDVKDNRAGNNITVNIAQIEDRRRANLESGLSKLGYTIVRRDDDAGNRRMALPGSSESSASSDDINMSVSSDVVDVVDAPTLVDGGVGEDVDVTVTTSRVVDEEADVRESMTGMTAGVEVRDDVR